MTGLVAENRVPGTEDEPVIDTDVERVVREDLWIDTEELEAAVELLAGVVIALAFDERAAFGADVDTAVGDDVGADAVGGASLVEFDRVHSDSFWLWIQQ